MTKQVQESAYSVILNAAQRSEESKIAARKPVPDFRFLASLKMTEMKAFVESSE